MKATHIIQTAVLLLLVSGRVGDTAEPLGPRTSPSAAPSVAAPQKTYVLSPNDLVLIKVYRHDDLESKLRIASDGTSTFPLLGTVQLGGKTLEEATGYLRNLLGADYLVNPQITVTILEYAKRRFTVLGHVQKPGAYEIPSEESVNLLEAIAIAGGFTRLANSAKITVTRVVGDKKASFVLDAKDMTTDTEFIVRPDDTITVPQRIL